MKAEKFISFEGFFLFSDAFKKTIHIFKNLDIVVNNAGIVNEIQWEKTVAVNLVQFIIEM